MATAETSWPLPNQNYLLSGPLQEPLLPPHLQALPPRDWQLMPTVHSAPHWAVSWTSPHGLSLGADPGSLSARWLCPNSEHPKTPRWRPPGLFMTQPQQPHSISSMLSYWPRQSQKPTWAQEKRTETPPLAGESDKVTL